MRSVTVQTLRRLPVYLNYLKSLSPPPDYISATSVSEALGLGEVQVRKDLALVCEGGRPKLGYPTGELVSALEQFLGYDDVKSAVLIGTGHLGLALLSYEGFRECGLDIVAGFDIDPTLVGTEYCGKPILPMEKLGELCDRLKLHIGIITVPGFWAQEICDILIKHGIRAIWNFAPTHLVVPEGILVQHENMAASLAMLSNHLSDELKQREK